MYKKLATLAAAVMLTLSATSAFATFADLQLTRVVLNQTGGVTEIATTLGDVNALLASGGTAGNGLDAFTAQVGGSSADFANLSVVYFAVDTVNRHLWVTGLNPAGTIGKSGTITGAATSLFQYYNTLLPGGLAPAPNATANTVLGDASNSSSYRVKMDATTQFGQFCNFITVGTRANTEASLASLATTPVVQNLYYFANYATNAAGVLARTITTKADGSTSISAAVVKTAQTISSFVFNPQTLAVGDTTTASATASSGLTVSFASTTPTICTTGISTLNGTVSSSTVTALSAGTCTITADQAGNTTYNAAPTVTQNITVLSDQAIGPITFIPPNLTVGTNSTVYAVSNSALPVTFNTKTPASCSVAGSTVSGVALGTCTVTAAQAGDATFAPASQVAQNISVIAPIIKIDTATIPNNTLNAALAIPTANATIYLQAAPVFLENVLMSNPATILLYGGYTDSAFSTETLSTTINGSLTVRNGTLKVRQLVVM
jgi:hypothetical protein